MLFFKLAILGFGAFLIFKGYEEFTLSRSADSTPLALDLSALEAGTFPDNNYLEINEHWAVFPYAVYNYQEEAERRDEPSDAAKVNYLYYPIISETHPFNVAVDELYLQFPDGNIPDELVPAFQKPAVLVKSKRFKTIGQIPNEWMPVESISGLVINRVARFQPDEPALLLESFPDLDFEQVIVLEDGRKPSSASVAMLMAGGGAFVVLIGIGAFLDTGKRKRPA